MYDIVSFLKEQIKRKPEIHEGKTVFDKCSRGNFPGCRLFLDEPIGKFLDVDS